MKTHTMQQLLDEQARLAFGRTRTEAHQQGRCVDCGASVHYDVESWGPGAIYSPEGLKEYGISGLCEYCFDAIAEGQGD